MAGGTSGLFPSLEASRRERERKEKEMLPAMIEKVALGFEGKKRVPVREYIKALNICERYGLKSVEDILKAYYGTEDKA